MTTTTSKVCSAIAALWIAAWIIGLATMPPEPSEAERAARLVPMGAPAYAMQTYNDWSADHWRRQCSDVEGDSRAPRCEAQFIVDCPPDCELWKALVDNPRIRRAW